MAKLYYIAPEESLFNELKDIAIDLWSGYDDTYGYATEKIGRIKDIQNVRDNFMYIVAMFDIENQRKLSNSLSNEACKAIRDRMVDGGSEEQYIVF